MIKVLLLILFLSFSSKVYSLEVTLTQGSVKPTPIAVTDLHSDNPDLIKLGKNISNIIYGKILQLLLIIVLWRGIDEKSFFNNLFFIL